MRPAKNSETAKIKALITFRAFFVTVLLGSFTVFEIGNRAFPHPEAVFRLIEILYGLTIAYVFFLGKVKPRPFAYFQLTLDVLAVCVLIYLTGGIESWFPFLLILLVLASGIIIGRRAGFVIASLSSILYGSMIDLQYWRLIPLPYGMAFYEKDFLYNIFSNITALYLTAYLTGYLSWRLERTSRKLEEKATDFRELTAFNKEVLENMPSGLMVMDGGGRLITLNRAGAALMGISGPEAAGRHIKSIFPFIADHRAPNIRAEGSIMTPGGEKTIGLTVWAMDGPARDGLAGMPSGYLCIFSDLTDIKRMEREMELKRRWATIGELSANIAHEIRNPLAALRGAVEMLYKDSPGEEQRESLTRIALSEMDRLNRIITDFLMYSRPAGCHPEPLELGLLLAGTLDLIGKAAPPGVETSAEIDPGLNVHADPDRLHQVFYNLALNAFDAMPEGGRLRVRARRKDGQARILFADTGKGIAPEEAQKVFFPFYTTKATGTGLGLSIAMRIMEDHGGTIRLESGAGRGAEFTVIMPLNGKV
ncbi:MAG: ATP-binding protein [Nitrospiraceae bacterium]|nr:ATP-binding protein [Nitrospiraceae bacterium]